MKNNRYNSNNNSNNNINNNSNGRNISRNNNRKLPPLPTNVQALPPPPPHLDLSRFSNLPPLQLHPSVSLPPPPLPLSSPPPLQTILTHDEIPPPPSYKPITHHAQCFLNEFKEKSISLATSMGEAVHLLKVIKVSPSLQFIALPLREQEIWNSFLQKAIIACEEIHKIENPFLPIDMIACKSPSEFSLADFKWAIDYIHSCVFDDKFNIPFKQRAKHCLWLTLYFNALMNSPFVLNNLNHYLARPFQRVFNLSSLSDTAAKDYVRLQDQNALKNNIHLQKLIERAKIMADITNKLIGVLDSFMILSNPHDFSLFYIQNESMTDHIENIISLVLNEDVDENGVANYINNVFALQLVSRFNSFFKKNLYSELAEKIYNDLTLLLKHQGIHNLKNAIDFDYNSKLSADEKVMAMLEKSSITLVSIKANLKPGVGNNNLVAGSQSDLARGLEKLIDQYSQIVKVLLPQEQLVLQHSTSSYSC